MRSTQETRRWAFFAIGAMMCSEDVGAMHGPWSHPHTAQLLAHLPQCIPDPYAHDHAQRTAAQSMPWLGDGPAPDPPTLAIVWARWEWLGLTVRRYAFRDRARTLVEARVIG